MQARSVFSTAADTTTAEVSCLSFGSALESTSSNPKRNSYDYMYRGPASILRSYEPPVGESGPPPSHPTLVARELKFEEPLKNIERELDLVTRVSRCRAQRPIRVPPNACPAQSLGPLSLRSLDGCGPVPWFFTVGQPSSREWSAAGGKPAPRIGRGAQGPRDSWTQGRDGCLPRPLCPVAAGD